MSSPFLVSTDEVWENGRWSFTNWTGAVFTNFRGTVNFDNFPSLPLAPEGWEWQSDWTVDMSCSFGEIDDQGWCYGASKEALQKSIEDNCTTSTSSGIKALVRRRRWTRSRACTNYDIYIQIKNKLEELQTLRLLIEKSMRQQQKNITTIKQYDMQRVNAYESTIKNFADDMNVIGQVMKNYVEKLIRTKSYLIERSEVERAYAASLKSLGHKWMDKGDTERKSGFFSIVSQSSLNVAGNIEDFSELLVKGICKDVEDLLVEASQIASACLSEGPRLIESLHRKEEIVVEALRNLHADVDKYISQASTDVLDILNEIIVVKNTGTVPKPKDANQIQSATPTSLATSMLKLKQSDVILLNQNHSDIFIYYQKYRRAVSHIHAHLAVSEKLAEKQLPKARALSMKVSALLQSIIKLFANEQMRVWSGGRDLIEMLNLSIQECTAALNPGAVQDVISLTSKEADGNMENNVIQISETDLKKSFDGSEINSTVQIDPSSKEVDSGFLDHNSSLSMPKFNGIVKEGVLRFCTNVPILLATASQTGVVQLDAESVIFKTVYAVLYTDGMLYLYENIPLDKKISPSQNEPPILENDDDDASNRGSSIGSLEDTDTFKEFNWIGDIPLRSLNISGVKTNRNRVVTSDFDHIEQLMCITPEHEAFKLNCPTSVPMSLTSMSSPVRTVSVITTADGCASIEVRKWIQAISEPYTKAAKLHREKKSRDSFSLVSDSSDVI